MLKLHCEDRPVKVRECEVCLWGSGLQDKRCTLASVVRLCLCTCCLTLISPSGRVGKRHSGHSGQRSAVVRPPNPSHAAMLLALIRRDDTRHMHMPSAVVTSRHGFSASNYSHTAMAAHTLCCYPTIHPTLAAPLLSFPRPPYWPLGPRPEFHFKTLHKNHSGAHAKFRSPLFICVLMIGGWKQLAIFDVLSTKCASILPPFRCLDASRAPRPRSSATHTSTADDPCIYTHIF
jgi:hypothetical protein